MTPQDARRHAAHALLCGIVEAGDMLPPLIARAEEEARNAPAGAEQQQAETAADILRHAFNTGQLMDIPQ